MSPSAFAQARIRQRPTYFDEIFARKLAYLLLPAPNGLGRSRRDLSPYEDVKIVPTEAAPQDGPRSEADDIRCRQVREHVRAVLRKLVEYRIRTDPTK